MKLQVVNFEIAKELKVLGFNWPTIRWYDNDRFLYNSVSIEKYNDRDWQIAAFTQAEVVKWLRDIYDIHIQPSYCVFYDALYQHHVGYRLNIIFGGICPMNYILSNEELNVKYNGSLLNGHGIVFDAYETTELEGIKEAIRYLKSKINDN